MGLGIIHYAYSPKTDLYPQINVYIANISEPCSDMNDLGEMA
jgi:hypothetical protein